MKRRFFGRIPPVGNPIALGPVQPETLTRGKYKTWLVQSGTAALAAALQITKDHCKSDAPEVILPAYCCPDVLAAVLFCEMKPILVDLEPDQPYYDLEHLKEALTKHTAAVIAINFLGIPERTTQIRKILKHTKALLVEDSAQWFPEDEQAFELHQGDLVTYSFGKGKPVSLLGGGAITIKNQKLNCFKPNITARKKKSILITLRAKFALYNQLISPKWYWLLEILPGLKLGDTQYHPLNAIESMDQSREKLLEANISSYRRHSRTKSLNEYKKSLLKLKAKGKFLLDEDSLSLTSSHLRLPFLASDAMEKQRLLSAARDKGLGISGLYPDELLKLKGIPTNLAAKHCYDQAQIFSSRLLTIPTHIYAPRFREQISSFLVGD